MSSCAECHGMGGEKYDDHSTVDCPRLKENVMTDIQPEREALLAKIDELIASTGFLKEHDKNRDLYTEENNQKLTSSAIAEYVADFILTDRQAQRSRICGEITDRFPTQRINSSLHRKPYVEENYDNGFNDAVRKAWDAVQEVENSEL